MPKSFLIAVGPLGLPYCTWMLPLMGAGPAVPLTVYSPNWPTVQVRRTCPLEPTTAVCTVELVTDSPVSVAVTVAPEEATTSR